MSKDKAKSDIFSQQYQRLATNLVSSPGQLEIARARAPEYRRYFDEVGSARFTLGVTKAIDNHSSGFFPGLGEFKDFVPSTETAFRSLCPKCDGSQPGGTEGFVIVKKMVNGKFIDAAARCTHGGE
jgi:hypothetical protein